MAREIPLTKGFVAIVDDADFEWLSQWKWLSVGAARIYAARTVRREDGKWRHFYMHRLIGAPAAGQVVDHINGDSLDNTRANLRACSRTDNARNRRSSRELKGVYPRGERWMALITVDRKTRYLGLFGTPEEAASAYDQAAREHFGVYAHLNAPQAQSLGGR